MDNRRKGVLFCAICSGLALFLLGIAFYMMGNTNLGTQKVTFSVPTGFYEDEFDLEMEAGGKAIYYTLDCSEPDEHSIRYTGPIHIKDVSDNENHYSTITDVSPLLNWSFLEQEGIPIKYPYTVPTRPVDKATVIRAVSIDGNGARSEESEAVYFVGYRKKSGYDGSCIMTITTTPENLFSPKTGIYVLGETFTKYAKKGVDKGKVAPMSWSANYNQRGVKWERNAAVQLFNENRELLFSSNCGIRIQGESSRALLPKSLNLYDRNAGSEANFDTGTLFGDYLPLVYLNLNNGGNDNFAQIRDYIVNTMAADLNILTREYVPCVAFLDGEYWGNYWLTARLKKDYLSQKYHENPDNIIVIKQQRIEEGREEDLTLYTDLMRSICNNDMRERENYEQVFELVDMESCIDYYALEIYIANNDWPYKNYSIWRTRSNGTAPTSDCRWRWVLFDVNMALNSNNSNKEMIQHTINADALFASLMDNEEFANALYARILSMAERFRPDKTEVFIEACKADMGDAMAKHYSRFYEGEMTVEDFYEQCDSIQEFFAKRYEYINQTFAGKVQ